MPKQIVISDASVEDALILESKLRKKGVANPIQKLRDETMTIAYLQGSGPFSDRARYPLPSILFVDLLIAVRNDFELLRWLDSHPVAPKPRIIICGSSPALANLHQCRKMGADSFLLRESMEDQLKKVVFQFPDDFEFGDPAKS